MKSRLLPFALGVLAGAVIGVGILGIYEFHPAAQGFGVMKCNRLSGKAEFISAFARKQSSHVTVNPLLNTSQRTSVDIPDVGIVEFPESMGTNAINAACAKIYEIGQTARFATNALPSR